MLQRIQTLKPRLNALFRPRGKIFYGWWIVAACSGVQWLAAMTWMHSYGAYAVLMQEEFGWSMSVLSLAFALTRLESGLLGPLQGWLVDKFGTRLILTVGTIIFSIGFFVFSQVNSITTYFVAFILIALGSSLGGFATLMVSLVNWFDRHRSMAVAWSQIGFSLGGLSVPLVILGLEAWGWRTMAIISGCMVLFIAGPLVQMVKHRPEEIGEVPDGITISDAGIAQPHSSYQRQDSFTWREAVRTPAFWLISVGHGLSLLTVSSMLAHLIPHLTRSLNYTTLSAGIVFSAMTGAQLIGLFLGGYLGDRFEKTADLCGLHVGPFYWASGCHLCRKSVVDFYFCRFPWLRLGHTRAPHGGAARRLLRAKIVWHHHGYFISDCDDRHDCGPGFRGRDV